MKKRLLLSFCVLILINKIVISQTNGIDPRQFVNVLEIDRQTNKTLTLYENDTINILKVDVNSLISIFFNQESMSNKLDYYGNVSIIAKINDEPIKVSPYSKVGEKQGEIGVNSASPIEISSHLLGLLRQMKSLENSIRDLFEDKFYEKNTTNSLGYTEIDYAIAYFSNKEILDTAIYTGLPEKLQGIITTNTKYSPSLLLFSQNDLVFTNKKLKDELDTLKKNLSDDKSEQYMKSVKSKMTMYQDVKQNLDLSKEYLYYFQNGDAEIKDLYLRLMKQDKLAINDFANKLALSSKKLQAIDTISVVNFNEKEAYFDEYLRLIMNSIKSYNNKAKSSISDIGLNLYVNNEFVDEENKEELEKELAKKVGNLIYQKLLVGNIDLREARAKEGDILKISILWYQKSDSTSTPLELDLVVFNIKNVGWRLKVYDSFFLINRFNEPKGEENLSPSKFKGAPGVSLLYTYGNNGYKNNVFKRLEPSLGINVSYIDFYTNKDLEVGVGLVLGLFKNQIFITAGYNLHSEQNGGYVGLGFSFSNIASQIKK